MDYFILKEYIVLWRSQPSITYDKYYTTNIFIWRSGLKTCFHTDRLPSDYHKLKQNVFFILWQEWKHYPVFIISQTKSAANIFVWLPGLKTLFHGDYRLQQYILVEQVSYTWVTIFLFHALAWKYFFLIENNWKQVFIMRQTSLTVKLKNMISRNKIFQFFKCTLHH